MTSQRGQRRGVVRAEDDIEKGTGNRGQGTGGRGQGTGNRGRGTGIRDQETVVVIDIIRSHGFRRQWRLLAVGLLALRHAGSEIIISRGPPIRNEWLTPEVVHL
jgi:hypothetical protein